MKKITTFWKWFADNESALKTAIVNRLIKDEALMDNSNEELISLLYKKLGSVSKRIGILINGSSGNLDRFTIIFTAKGYPIAFEEIMALEQLAPQLQHFIPQAFINPFPDMTPFIEKTDPHCIYPDCKIRISDLQMSLTDYDIESKTLKIKVFMPDYDNVKKEADLDTHLMYIVMGFTGEMSYRLHIQEIEFAQLPDSAKGLLSLIELPDYIQYLYKINSRGKTRFI